MNDKLARNHISYLAEEFALELLPNDERQLVTRHIAHCIECRQVVETERQVARLVRSTIEATGVSRSRLNELRPKAPKRQVSFLNSLSLRRQIAFAGLLLILVIGGTNLVMSQSPGGFISPTSTAYVATASLTRTPTAGTSSPTPITSPDQNETVISQQAKSVRPFITPAPQAVDVN
jgi:anti-sigma factor RsiW